MVKVKGRRVDQATDDKGYSQDTLKIAADKEDALDNFLLLLPPRPRSLKLLGDVCIGCDLVAIGVYHV